MWVDTNLVLTHDNPDVKGLIKGCKFKNPQFLHFARKGKVQTAKYLKIEEYLEHWSGQDLPDGTHVYRFPRALADRYPGITLHTRGESRVITTDFKGFPLRSGQEKAVRDFVRKIRNAPSGCGIYRGPCGSGKTIVGCEIARQLGCKTLILVDKDILIDQWVDALESYLGFSEDQYFIRDGKKLPPKSSLVDIYTVQSIMPHNNPMPEEIRTRYGLVLIDECHIVPAETISKVISTFPARYVVGTTATAVRKDGLQDLIFAYCGNILTDIESPRVTPTIRILHSPQVLPDTRSVLSHLNPQGGTPLCCCDRKEVIRRIREALAVHPDRRRLGNNIFNYWDRHQRDITLSVDLPEVVERIMYTYEFNGRCDRDPRTGDKIPIDSVADFLYKIPHRNKIILRSMVTEYYNGRHIMALSARKWYCAYLQEILKKIGIRSEIITGDTTPKRRRALLKEFKAEEFRIILATRQLVEKGLDVPILDCGFLLSPTRVLSVDEGGDLEQCIGRFQRPKVNPLVPEALIYEVLDGGDPPNVMIQKHIRYYRKQGFPVEILRNGVWSR